MAFSFLKRKRGSDSLSPLKDYQVGDPIGEGSYATVYKGKFKRDNHPTIKSNQKVVIKKISKEKSASAFLDVEVEAAKRLNHKNIAHSYAQFEDSSNLYLVQEYFKANNLFDFMDKRRFRPIDENRARVIFRQLVDALIYAKSQGINHRDIKLENILIGEDDTIKLIDWGLCAVDTNESNQWVGSPDYVAPEILLHKPYNTELVDCWSLGVILFILIAGKLPFSRRSRREMLLQGRHPLVSFPSYVNTSEESKDLIRKLLSFNTDTRFTLEDIVKHSWTQDI